MERYIYDIIVPRYAAHDSAHREDHALTVISQVLSLLERMPLWLAAHPEAEDEWNGPVDRNMLMMAAACHDIGLVNGRDRHHLDSGIMIREDMELRKWFSEEQIETIAQAAEDHRASGKTPPRSIYGKIVAEADRVIDGETIIRRTVQFGLNNYPELDRKGHIERAVAHLREKYGRGGYLKLWIPWSDNASRLSELQDIIENDDAVYGIVTSIFEKTR